MKTSGRRWRGCTPFSLPNSGASRASRYAARSRKALDALRHAARPRSADNLSPLVGLQYLRAAAAISVVIFHAAPVAGYSFQYGAFGVDLFFVLSGFLMMSITDERSRPTGFLFNRLRRVVPLYWCALALTLLLSKVGFPTPALTPSRIATSFAFLPHPAGSPPYYPPFLNVGWTLNFELFFYTLFAMALLLPRPFQLAALTAVFGCLFGLRLAGATEGPALFWTNPIMFEFLAGAWLSVLWRRRPRVANRRGWLLIVAAVPLVFLLYALQPLLFPFHETIDRVPLVVPAMLVLMGILCLEGSSGRVSYWRLPALLGDASYSIYLFHRFGLFAGAALAASLGLAAGPTLGLLLVLGVGSGLVAHYLLERPLLRLFRKRLSPIGERLQGKQPAGS